MIDDETATRPPYTVRVTPTGTDIHFAGVVTGENLVAAQAASSAHPAGARRFVLADFSAIEGLQVSADDVRRLVAFYGLDTRPGRDREPPALVAIAAPQMAAYGMARMWELYAESLRPAETTYVARSRVDAIAWLVEHGVPRGELAP